MESRRTLFSRLVAALAGVLALPLIAKTKPLPPQIETWKGLEKVQTILDDKSVYEVTSGYRFGRPSGFTQD